MSCIPPVHSPLRMRDLARGAAAALRLSDSQHSELKGFLMREYGGREVILCDSGTSALVAAFRLVSRGRRIRVACPAYVCVDVGAAAKSAGIELVLYDTDPTSLSPDSASLTRVIQSGVEAVLVAHLFGFPVDLDRVIAVCRQHDLPLIEDAAQEAGARYKGRRLGSFGDLSILSFGRGKGLTGGGGGALIVGEGSRFKSADTANAGSASLLKGAVPARAGFGELAAAVAQWVFARPRLYCLPLSVPWLRLGEMVYREAEIDRGMSRASVAIVASAMIKSHDAIAVRSRNAAMLSDLAKKSSMPTVVYPVGAEPSYLRFPVMPVTPKQELRHAGVVRGYPRLLHQDDNLAGVAIAGAESLAGAEALRDRCMTLPAHGMLGGRNWRRLAFWFQS